MTSKVTFGPNWNRFVTLSMGIVRHEFMFILYGCFCNGKLLDILHFQIKLENILLYTELILRKSSYIVGFSLDHECTLFPLGPINCEVRTHYDLHLYSLCITCNR